MTKAPKELLRSLFDAAVASAQPAVCVPPFLPNDVKGKLVVIGAGKASAAMARAVEDAYEGELEGLVVTRYGYGVPCDKIEILEAAHPVPDEAGLEASRRMMDYVSKLGADDTVLCLISGGGSALLPLPAPGISLEDKQAVNKELLACGATINEMNCVRRNLSQIKGGRLAAAAHPARIINLLISDVPGDDPVNIASGPTVQDTTTVYDALAIIERYGIALPEAAKAHLDRMKEEADAKGPSGAAPLSLEGVSIETHIVASPQRALEAAADVCAQEGIPAYILGDSIEGEASDVGVVFAGLSKQIVSHSQPFKAPCVLLSGGEATVTLKGKGRGGRNVEFLLSYAVTMGGAKNVYALAGDTDGVDGVEEIAGAICDPTTIERAWEKGISPSASLANNDGHGFFEALGDSVITGPTMTNVNDFRAILITEDGR
ncbi:glycerate kinase [Pseudovibrio sp. SPO723]|uniref:glycerate kinase type-2 family protein n=1 Tax=Nesiotobacter zosterae TaxID=392721 RepID=UPI0029C1EDE7|nr:glycerate kinase [Pseudovibrio sp. SPO723]MDX5595728.1 glycerate kinase [Pseudovibrio sp. SPO723]